MNISFKYDIEKDVENFLKSFSSSNSKKLEYGSTTKGY